jgi:hypothetical protein
LEKKTVLYKGKEYLLTIYSTLLICRWSISIEKDINVIYPEGSDSRRKKQGLQRQEKQQNRQNMPFWNKNWHFGKAISNCL